MTRPSSSDFTLGEGTSIHALFWCDGNQVTVVFMDGDHQIGESKTFTRGEASKQGKRAQETGAYDYLPLDLPTEYVKNFGIVLRRFGETGR